MYGFFIFDKFREDEEEAKKKPEQFQRGVRAVARTPN